MIHKAASNIEAMKGSLDNECHVDKLYSAASKQACLGHNFQLKQLLERLLRF